jgi:LacI family transcriptional regulator
MGGRTTIRELAKLSGVSVGTVSRALNGYPDVASETRARILRLATELEYTPAAAARTLVTQRSHVVGVFLETGGDHPDLQHPFFHEVMDGLKQAVGEGGYDLLWFAAQRPGNGFVDQSYLNRCRHHDVDGVVLMGVYSEDPEVRRLVRSEVPCVGVDVDLGAEAVLVASDNVAGARMAVEHLYGLGHRRIATITGLIETRPCIDRLRGYRSAIQALRLAYRDEYVVYGDYYVESGSDALQQLLALDEPPTGLVVQSDLMAVGAIRAATAAGLRVPDDLSVVGFDDMSMAPHMRPSLTTIRQDKARLGREAAAALLRQIERSPEQPEPALQPEPQPPTVTLPVELVVRGSTAPVDGIES